jgi:hypothetical protein
MRLSFDVAGMPAEFHRNPWTGKAELRIGRDLVPLQSPFRLSAHFELRTRMVWRSKIGDHDIEIVKVRPRIFAGFRPQTITISVDKGVVAEATGK